jgi:hypothetical protein
MASPRLAPGMRAPASQDRNAYIHSSHRLLGRRTLFTHSRRATWTAAILALHDAAASRSAIIMTVSSYFMHQHSPPQCRSHSGPPLKQYSVRPHAAPGARQPAVPSPSPGHLPASCSKIGDDVARIRAPRIPRSQHHLLRRARERESGLRFPTVLRGTPCQPAKIRHSIPAASPTMRATSARGAKQSSGRVVARSSSAVRAGRQAVEK